MKPYEIMMTSLNGNIFRVSGPLRGESTGHRWNPLTKANAAEPVKVDANEHMKPRDKSHA